MRHLTVVTIVLGLCLVLGKTAAAQTAAERGMKVYADQRCSLCHAIAGKGNAKGALDGVGNKLTADDIRKWLVSPAEMTKATKSERKPPMKAYASLPKEDVDALVAYMLTLKAR